MFKLVLDYSVFMFMQLKILRENKDKIEIYLAFGATRVEACRPIAIQALKLVFLPIITSMRYAFCLPGSLLPCQNLWWHSIHHSVMGIIAIPGTMTGAILGGSSVHQAAKLQMIIMFMITATAGLASIFMTFTAILMLVDQEHQIRSDHIDDKKPAIYRVKDWNVEKHLASLLKSFSWRTRKSQTGGDELELEENKRLFWCKDVESTFTAGTGLFDNY
jgi:hypothetical protein